MEYYIGNIVAAIAGFGTIGSILIAKYFDHSLLTTWNIVSLAVGGTLIAASIIGAISTSRKLKALA